MLPDFRTGDNPPIYVRDNTPIYVSGRDKPIGYVSGRTFFKTITGSKHLLQRPKAIAFDRSTLDDAERAGATQVSVRDVETGSIYIAPIADIRRFGFPVLRGYGNQVALSLDYYAINGQPPAAAQRAAETNKAIAELQLGLFA